MTMKQDAINEDTPTIKRVVNIKCLRFKSINENFETRSRPHVDLNKLNFSGKEVTFSGKDYAGNADYKSSKRETFKEPLLRQTSELDIGENFEIQKTNPIFEPESMPKFKGLPRYEKSASEPASALNNHNASNKDKHSVHAMSRLMLPRASKEHIYEDVYQSIDPNIITNNTYDIFYDKSDILEKKDQKDFRLTINVDNTTSPNENDPIYIDPAEFAKNQEKDITIVNLSNGTISKSLGKHVLSDIHINDIYKSALTEKLKLNTKSLVNNQSKSGVGNSESSGISTMFGSFLKNDDSSTSDEFSFQSQLYKDSVRSESGFMGFNQRNVSDFLTEVRNN